MANEIWRLGTVKGAEMKNKCKVCTVMCDISRGNELRACAFEHNGDENICPFDARYLDLSEHDKQVRADAIDECEKEIEKHYQYDCEIGGYIRLRELNLEQLKEQNNE